MSRDSKVPLRTKSIEHRGDCDRVHYRRMHLSVGPERNNYDYNDRFQGKERKLAYHCTRTSRADKVELPKNIPNLVPSGPCGAEKRNDRAISILQLQTIGSARCKAISQGLPKYLSLKDWAAIDTGDHLDR